MDRLVSTEWLEEQLGSPALRVLDCTVSSEVLPDGGVNYRSGREGWERKHIPGSAHVDRLQQISDSSSPFPFMLPPPLQFSEAMSELGIGKGTRVVVYDRFINTWAARV